MADPVKYTIGYSFSGFQALNPDSPLPAPSLDAELSDIQVSISGIVDAITGIRRADGNLQNSVVSWDGLNDDVKERINGSVNGVTVGDLSPAAFANVPEAEAGAANDRLMTPLRTKDAIDAQRAFASQSAAETGAETSTVMSPARTKDAIDDQRAFSSQPEAEAGTDADTVLSPLRGAQMLAALRRTHSNSAALTWGSIASAASAEQTLSVPGALIGERVILGLPASGVEVGLVPQAWVSAADQVKIRITNTSGGPLTPHSGAATSYAVTVIGF